jgi:hypothetical protein
MNSKPVERSLTGDYRAESLGEGAWRLSSGAPGAAALYLSGADPQAAGVLAQSRASRIGLVFGSSGVTVSWVTAQGTRQLRARAATIHEPLPQLYEGLPLARFDARARRFWRRVFLLVRIPGGRRLLGLVARRANRSK